MRKNKNPISSSPSNPVSIISLIHFNPVIILKEFYSALLELSLFLLKVILYIWGVRADKNKLCTVRNVTQNLQMEKPADTKETCCDDKLECHELSLQELKMVMEKLGTSYNPDADKLQDTINSVEITALFEEQEPSLQEVKEAFCIFDRNNDGFIDAAELKNVISTLHPTTPSLSDCASMIRAYDDNHDGVIDFNEFLKLMTCSFS